MDRRLSFDHHADAYHAGRPGFPPLVYDWLAQSGLRAGVTVLEIGAGSGQATCELLARGAIVVAVEPGANLAAMLPRHERLSVVAADFEATELAAHAYDVVVAATSFHWIDADRALPKIAGALRPGGWLAVWWTEFGDVTRRSARSPSIPVSGFTASRRSRLAPCGRPSRASWSTTP